MYNMDAAPQVGHLAPAPRGRGIHWMGHPRISGSVIGAIGGSAFVLANHSALPGPWATVAVWAWAGSLMLYLWAVFVTLRPEPSFPRPARFALWIYLASVAGMVAAMPLGAWALRSVGLVELQVAWVVMAVGLHFLPFAKTFDAPVFGLLGWLFAALGALGLVLGWLVAPVAAPSAAVLAGIAMVVAITIDALRSTPPGDHPGHELSRH
jgi:hypothetical protein